MIYFKVFFVAKLTNNGTQVVENFDGRVSQQCSRFYIHMKAVFSVTDFFIKLTALFHTNYMYFLHPNLK